MPPAPDLLLFKRDDCPFCQKVAAKIAALKLTVPSRDTAGEAGARDQLIAIGGRGQVPCLVIDGRPMYESDSIIAYLDTLAARS